MLLVLSGGAGRIHPLHIVSYSLKFGLISVLTIFEVLHPSDHFQDCFTLFLLCQFNLLKAILNKLGFFDRSLAVLTLPD